MNTYIRLLQRTSKVQVYALFSAIFYLCPFACQMPPERETPFDSFPPPFLDLCLIGHRCDHRNTFPVVVIDVMTAVWGLWVLGGGGGESDVVTGIFTGYIFYFQFQNRIIGKSREKEDKNLALFIVLYAVPAF